MPVPVVDGVIKESKGHPYTMLALVFLLVVVPWMYTHMASADDLRTVQQQLSNLNYNYLRGNLEARLEAAESDIFNLEQKIKEKQAAHQQVDDVYYQQLNKLTISKGELERQLANLK